MLTFEFPAADQASAFFERVDAPAGLKHRVVEVQQGDPDAVRSLARELAGREVPSWHRGGR